jgi:hypothetical protein
MRLLSFLADIERALIAGSPAVEGGAWESQRMVSFHHGLARLTLAPRAEIISPGGSVFLQSFSLADGSLCLKASLTWKSSEALQVVPVYSTPNLNWKLEAARIATAWLQGPPAISAPAVLTDADLRPLTAAAS